MLAFLLALLTSGVLPLDVGGGAPPAASPMDVGGGAPPMTTSVMITPHARGTVRG